MTTTSDELDYEVIVVGAGVAGASAAYHLTASTMITTKKTQQQGTTTTTGSMILVLDEGRNAGEGISSYHDDEKNRRSGSAVMEDAATIKMMVQLYATSSKTFVSHHGTEGAARYLAATEQGLVLQKEIATKVLDDPQAQLQQLGSFYVAYEEDEAELREEYELLKALGGSSFCSNVEWYGKDQLQNVPGCPPIFHCAIRFPSDAIIDSSSYAKALLRYCESQGSTRVMYETRVNRVEEIQDNNNDGTGVSGGAVVHLENGTQLRCRHVVMATGGLWQVPELNGILRPCYSYLVHVPIETITTTTNQYDAVRCETSSNFFTWGFTHDWCVVQGKVRNSGEDHFSAYKDPKTKERCGNLIQWTLDAYQCKPLDADTYHQIPQQNGVYSETPDYAPLVGTRKIQTNNNNNSNNKNGTSSGSVCYLLGCNAFGQAVLSYVSSLVPGLLGYRPLTSSEKESMKLFTIRRFVHLPLPLKN